MAAGTDLRFLGLHDILDNNVTLWQVAERLEIGEDFNKLEPAAKANLLLKMACFILPLRAAYSFDPITLTDSMAFIQFLKNYAYLSGDALAAANNMLASIKSEQYLLTVISLTATRRTVVLANELLMYRFQYAPPRQQ